MKCVEWGEYRLGNLFEIGNTLGFNVDKLVEGNSYDYVTRTSFNQGVLKTTGFVNERNINSSGTWSLGLLQMDFFYRKNPWYAGQFVRIITPKINIPQGATPFITAILNSQKSILLNVLVRDVDKTFNNLMVKLPKKNGGIDFEFMEMLVSELEGDRIDELEAYLLDIGLEKYELTDKERQSIDDFSNLVWGTYSMKDLFEKLKTKKLPYKADVLPKRATGKYVLPCLTSSFKNQGLNYFVPREEATVLKSVISIPSNSDVYRAYFQSRDFTVLSDAYAIGWKSKEKEFSPNHYLFTVPCINKVIDLPIYSYKNKLGGWNVVKNKNIQLPVKNNTIDFEYMETLISALQKLLIKDVILYIDRNKEKKKGKL